MKPVNTVSVDAEIAFPTSSALEKRQYIDSSGTFCIATVRIAFASVNEVSCLPPMSDVAAAASSESFCEMMDDI